MRALPALRGLDGNVFILQTDMPLLAYETLNKLQRKFYEEQADGVILTLTIENPPEFGRIIRGADGRVERVVEERDCTEEEKAINEVNVGVYYFDDRRITEALGKIDNHNAQIEYYLTDVVCVIASEDGNIQTYSIADLDEAMGVNAPYQLDYVASLDNIHHAESMYDLIDAMVRMSESAH